ncbi:hypothetical protein QNK12_09975 [Neobacillus cucumis]|nr:hypothetical protein QNK12_09975 [Neobacillus cucumis]
MEFRMMKLDTGKILIDGDTELLKKIEGEDLSNTGINDLQLDANTLSNQYLIATSHPDITEAKRYAVLKQAFLSKFSK